MSYNIQGLSQSIRSLSLSLGILLWKTGIQYLGWTFRSIPTKRHDPTAVQSATCNCVIVENSKRCILTSNFFPFNGFFNL